MFYAKNFFEIDETFFFCAKCYRVNATEIAKTKQANFIGKKEKETMKKTFKTVLIFAMCALLFALGACGKKDDAKTDAVTDDRIQDTSPVLDGSDEDKN